MSVSDEQLIEAVVDAVRQGHSSASDIRAYCGLTAQKALRLTGLAIQSRRIRMNGRDNRNSPTFELVQAQPSELVAEVVA